MSLAFKKLIFSKKIKNIFIRALNKRFIVKCLDELALYYPVGLGYIINYYIDIDDMKSASRLLNVLISQEDSVLFKRIHYMLHLAPHFPAHYPEIIKKVNSCLKSIEKLSSKNKKLTEHLIDHNLLLFT